MISNRVRRLGGCCRLEGGVIIPAVVDDTDERSELTAVLRTEMAGVVRAICKH
jgi:hypothetical protein